MVTQNYPAGTQLEFLTGNLRASCYGKNAMYPHGHHGNAILSRLPIRQFANHDISDHALEKRGLLHADRARRNASAAPKCT